MTDDTLGTVTQITVMACCDAFRHPQGTFGVGWFVGVGGSEKDFGVDQKVVTHC